MSDEDRVHLETESTPSGESWWNWSVWIQGSDKALAELESVRYVLHPTFLDPVRIVADRSTKFRLDSAGWGEFAIAAEVTRNDKRTFRLEKWLDLGFQGAGIARKPCVFLSFGAADAPWAWAIKGDLTKQGVDVVSAQDAAPGLSLTTAINDSLTRCDLVAFVTTGELRGLAEVELDQARQRRKAYVPILVGREASLPPQFAGEKTQPVQMWKPSDSLNVADAIRARVNDLTIEDR
jgi:pYEATS domain-containing protein involved in immunity/TIR domain-containing protein